MMRTKTIMGVVAAAVLMGACANTSPSPPGEAAGSPAPASKFSPRWEDSGKIPDNFLELARKQFLGFLYPKDVEEARALLRFLVLEKSPRFLAETRAYMVKNDWDFEFIKEYDKIEAWYDRLWKGPPKKIYEEAHVFLSKGLAKGRFNNNKYIGDRLLFAAGALGYFKGLQEYAQSYLDRKSESDRSIGRHWLRETADLDYVPAQLEIADRYLTGRGFERNKALALYWLGRAAMKGAEVKSRIETLKAEISADEFILIMDWSSRNYAPRD